MKQEIPNMLDISINLYHSHLWDPLYPTNNINRFVLQGSGNFTWRVSDYEELVGVTHLEKMGSEL